MTCECCFGYVGPAAAPGAQDDDPHVGPAAAPGAQDDDPHVGPAGIAV